MTDKEKQLAKIKLTHREECSICKREAERKYLDHAHILPRSLFPEFITEPRNLTLFCRDCHTHFDDSRAFRRQQIELYDQVVDLDVRGSARYFGMND